MDIRSINKYQDLILLQESFNDFFEHGFIDLSELIYFIEDSGKELVNNILTQFNFTCEDYYINLFISSLRNIVEGVLGEKI